MESNVNKVIFTDFVVKKNNHCTTIKGLPQRKGLENIGIYFIYLIPAIVIYYLLGAFVYFIFALIVAIIVFIISRSFLSKLFSFTLLVLDPDKNTFTSLMDKFEIHYKEIKTISIVEDVFNEGPSETKLYRLKFTLHDGEKTASFAFISYDKLSKVLEVINQEIKQ